MNITDVWYNSAITIIPSTKFHQRPTRVDDVEMFVVDSPVYDKHTIRQYYTELLLVYYENAMFMMNKTHFGIYHEIRKFYSHFLLVLFLIFC